MVESSTSPWRFRGNPQAYTLSNDRVLILSERERVLLSGRPYALVCPQLKGAGATLGSLQAILEGQLPADVVAATVATLEKKGYVSAEPAPVRSDKLLPSDVATFDDLAGVPISVKDHANSSGQRLRQRLSELGVQLVSRSKDAALTVICTGNVMCEALGRFESVAASSWTFVKLSGSTPMLGPIFQPGKSPCWKCLVAWQKESYWTVADLLGAEALSAEDAFRAIEEDVADWALEAVIDELAGRRGQPGGRQSRELISWEGASSNRMTHHIYPRRGCETCCRTSLQFAWANISLSSCPKVQFSADGPRSRHCNDTLRKVMPIVSSVTGIVPSLREKKIGEHWVVYGVRNYSIGRVRHSPRSPDVVTGKSITRTAAVLGCLAEAEERYASCFPGGQTNVTARYGELSDRMIHPKDLLLVSGAQYSTRTEWNARHGPFNQVPEPIDDGPVGWTRTWSLTKEEPVWLPSSYCFIDYPVQVESGCCPGDSNGLATGNSIEEAITYGLLEVIERDALAIWWYNGITRSGPKRSLLSESIQDQLRKLEERGRICSILDITSNLEVPVFAAVSAEKDGSRICIGTGCSTDPMCGVQRAVNEMCQVSSQLDLDRNRPATQIRAQEAEFERWLWKELASSHRYLRPGLFYSSWPEYQVSPANRDFLTDIGELEGILSDNGLESMVLDLSRPHGPLHTVKVVVPGLRSSWARYGAGRLYSVPVALGWLQAPMSESELNPIPYFL